MHMGKLKTLLYSAILSLGSAGAIRPAVAAESFVSDHVVAELLAPNPNAGGAEDDFGVRLLANRVLPEPTTYQFHSYSLRSLQAGELTGAL
jgi:hypothetical protein